MRTLEWDPSSLSLKMIDQRLLPGRLENLTCTTTEHVNEAIVSMAVRGAPAIGIAGAFGIVLAALNSPVKTRNAIFSQILNASVAIKKTRPTAVNLSWAVDHMVNFANHCSVDGQSMMNALIEEACRLADEDVATNRRMAEFGASLIDNGDTILHHCNTGSLATVDWGTALGAIRRAHEMGKNILVLVDETRPRLQGARLTAWELQQYSIPYSIITDNAAGYFLQTRQVQKVMFGADRVTVNGDIINKVGTYMLALAAHDNEIPVYPVFPYSTFDPAITNGRLVEIEERDPNEVLDLEFRGEKVVPEGALARNPAFDCTSHSLITAYVTDLGIIYPPFSENYQSIFISVPDGE